MAWPVFVYDGDCAFCTSTARFAQRVLPARVEWTPWQFADLRALGLTEGAVRESVQWVDGRGGRASGPVAIAWVLRASGGPWAVLGHVLNAKPVLLAAWPIYRWVARNRHRMPGGTPACAAPIRPSE
jgi:predicted DCC family thiol-disulfide oxidoreductase YuxK